MSDLTKEIVLVLNRAWQAINTRSPQEAFAQMATGVATALDIDGENMRPVQWDEWLTLPVRENDRHVKTTHGPVRIPSVIITVNYAKVPKKRPKLCARSIRERDKDRCQYTGRVLKPDEGSMDHIMPKSRGGKNDWKNLVWADKSINTRKSNKTPEEAGLRLLKEPIAPKEIPVTATLRNAHGIADWDLFLTK